MKRKFRDIRKVQGYLKDLEIDLSALVISV
jgi:hypothetical protein